jgi:hypothetical protein
MKNVSELQIAMPCRMQLQTLQCPAAYMQHKHCNALPHACSTNIAMPCRMHAAQTLQCPAACMQHKHLFFFIMKFSY